MITDIDAIENYMLIDIDAEFYSQINEWILAVQQYMNKATNRYLIADATASEYLYDGNGKSSLVIDDFIDIDTVEVLDSKDDDDPSDITDDVWVYPANSTPKWRLDYNSLKFVRGRQNIRVTGKRGFVADGNVATLYPDLKFAATVLVAGIINYAYQGDTGDKEVASESIGRYSVSYVTDSQKSDFNNVKATLKQYRRLVA